MRASESPEQLEPRTPAHIHEDVNLALGADSTDRPTHGNAGEAACGLFPPSFTREWDRCGHAAHCRGQGRYPRVAVAEAAPAGLWCLEQVEAASPPSDKPQPPLTFILSCCLTARGGRAHGSVVMSRRGNRFPNRPPRWQPVSPPCWERQLPQPCHAMCTRYGLAGGSREGRGLSPAGVQVSQAV